MNKNFTQKRIFLPHRYKREERFLSLFAKRGMMIKKAAIKGTSVEYIFTPCPPQEYTFIIDFVMPREISSYYLTKYQQAGFEMLCTTNGDFGGKWVYFVAKGNKERPKNDEFTKMNMFDKLYKKWGFITSGVFFSYALILYVVFGKFTNRALVGFNAFAAIICAVVFIVLFVIGAGCVIGLYIERNACIKRIKDN